MFYRLKEDLLLRGWDMLPTGLVRKLGQEVAFLPPKTYRTLQKATEMMPGSLFSGEEKKILEELVQGKILEESDTPVPLAEEQRYRSYPNRYLYSVHWAITGKCNCRCRHCYMSAPTRTDALVRARACDATGFRPPTAKIDEPSIEECLDIVKQMEAAGVRTVSLTGGEALTRRDFFTIVDALTEAGICLTTIMSNGLLVNEKTIGALTARGLKPEINMSFDGIGWHDWLRGIGGAEKAVIRAFELCKKNGIPTGAEYCLHKGNREVLGDSVKLLDELGCGSLKVNRLSLEGEGLKIVDYAISQEEGYETYLDYLPRYYEEKIKMPLMLAGFFYSGGDGTYSIPFDKKLAEDKDCGSYCLCGHARNHMYITVEGAMVPCVSMGSSEGGREQFPNIHDMGLAEALVDSSYMKFIDTRLRDYFAHNPDCAACEYKNCCAGGCRGHVAVSSGTDLLAKDEETCTFFKQGWYKRLIDKMAELGVKQRGAKVTTELCENC